MNERRSRLVVPFVIALAVVAVVLAGELLFRRAARNTNHVALVSLPKPVTVVAAKRAQYRPTRRYVGTVEPWMSAAVGPQMVAAYVRTVLVRPGATVHRGEVLATLDCREESASSRAIAMQAQALESHRQALAHLATRMGNLVDGGFVAANEVEQRNAESASEGARLESTRAQLAGHALAVDDCVLRAPFDGEIGARTVDPGAFVRPGNSLVDVISRDIVRIVADVPETDFAAVAPGTSVQLRMLATNRSLGADITRRSPSADPRTRTVHIEIDVPDGDRSLPVNTTAELVLDVGAASPASEIPLTAATVRGTRASLFVIDGDRVRARTVNVLGERGGNLFVDPAIGVGTRVVTEGRALLVDGDRVEIHTVESR